MPSYPTSYTPVNATYPPQYVVHDEPEMERNPRDLEAARHISRTPSPTPSEQRALDGKGFDWRKLNIGHWILIGILLLITILLAVFHTRIVNWLRPATKWLHDSPFGPLVAIGLLIVVSFPPLFGAEIISLLCGLAWGVGIGFAIVAAGTFLGEIANFFVFKYMCRERSAKSEQSSVSYASLVRVIREGGFKMALIARYSAIPPHFLTAVFASCGMNFWIYAAAAFLSLPKQFMNVYLGVLLDSSDNQSEKSKKIGDIVLAVTIGVTIVAMIYIGKKRKAVTPEIVYEHRKARQAKMARSSEEPFAIPSVQVTKPGAGTGRSNTWDQQQQYQSGSPGFARVDLPQARYAFAPAYTQ